MTSKIYQMKDGNVLAFPKTVGKAVENANGDTLENVEAGAQVNVVETIQLDGTAYAATNKVVDLPVYTKTQTDAKINSKIASAYKPGGTKTLATLPSLTADNLGFVYNMSADFTTTADFLEGAGKKFKAGVDVGIVNTGTDADPVYKYNVLAGFVDTDTYDAHVADTDIHVTTSNKATWNGKQDVISDLATIRSGAAAGATAVQPSAISDMATKTWVGQQGYLTQHQDISGKQDKITSSNKLSADLVSAGSTNAVVTLTEKSTYDDYASQIASKADATQTATALGLKANAADVYTKTQSDARYLTFEIVETYEA